MRGLLTVIALTWLTAIAQAEPIAPDTPTVAALAEQMEARARRLQTIAFRATSKVAGHAGMQLTRFGDRFELATDGVRLRCSEPYAAEPKLVRATDGSRYLSIRYSDNAPDVYIADGGAGRLRDLLDDQRTLLTLGVAQRPLWEVMRHHTFALVYPDYAVRDGYGRLVVVSLGAADGEALLYFSADHDHTLVRVEYAVRPGHIYRGRVLPKGDAARTTLAATQLVEVEGVYLPARLEGELSMSSANPRNTTLYARGTWTLSDYRLTVTDEELRLPAIPEDSRVRFAGDADKDGRLRVYRYRDDQFVSEAPSRGP